ncbi:hypothetical protein NG796_16240 [Laspinema sp. A4]|uniref:GumC family protein n=1 Tax=Laspinema sp. D2d TaxID=2953686 RepID=UPI0021BB368A|nr:hypothetical protein [Laspinema sp. D2d]MCT7984820.1 hypothetical protein [Laspinema sp. D2d]
MNIFSTFLKQQKIDVLAIPQKNSNLIVHPNQYKLLIYILFGLIGNIGIFSTTIFYTKQVAPTYRSEWSISIPGPKLSSYVYLPGIGQATSNVESPYNSNVADPRESYKLIARTDEVIEMAASQLNIPKNQLGRPRVQILVNSTLIQFQMESNSPESAQKKAFALQAALELRVQQLRQEEIQQQERNLTSTLDFAEHKLHDAQKRVSDYKRESILLDNDQIRDVSINLEQLRRQRDEQVAELQQVGARLQQLSADLGISVEEARDAFTLQSDAIFQQYLRAYSQGSSDRVQLSARFRPEHPALIAKTEEWEATQLALLQRSEFLLGRPMQLGQLKQLNIPSNNSERAERSQLLQDLIMFQNQYRGLEAQLQKMEQQLIDNQTRLSRLSIEKTQLDNIQRDVQIAEAVFSSMLTQLDLSQANVSVSYPPMLLLTQPNLPDQPTAPKKLLLLATVMGSGLLTSGLFGLWVRDRRIHINPPSS